MLYPQLSKLAVVSERSECPKANQSRLRRPTPCSIEYYRHEGVRASKDENPPTDSPRGRSKSSTWTPTRTRAPTPHPSATKSRRRKEEKMVQWTDPLELESPEQRSVPGPAPSMKKSAMRSSQPTQQGEEQAIQKDSSEAPLKQKSDESAASQEVQPCTLRRDRRSSIPRPKCTITRSNKQRHIVAPERPLSPLLPPAVPAPLRLFHRQTRISAIPSSTSAPEITSKTAARDFSFDRKPEVITVSPRSVHQNRPSSSTRNNSLQSGSTSYLQTRPKRAGTIHVRTRPTFPTSEVECEILGDSDRNASSQSITHTPGVTIDVLLSCSSPFRPKPLLSSPSASSFQSAKSFWSGLSASSSCGAIVSGFSPDHSFKPAFSMPKNNSSSSSNSEDLPKTSMASSLAKYTVNGGTSLDKKRDARKVGVSGSVSSTAARVSSRSRLPRSSSALSFRKKESNVSVLGRSASKTFPSQLQEHSKDGSSSTSSASKSTSSSSSYHTAKSHLSGTIGTNGTNSRNATPNTPSMTATSSSMETEYIPSLQSELWDDIMNFCRTDTSSVPPGERYCNCDDCLWSNEKDLKECSTVARNGERSYRARRE